MGEDPSIYVVFLVCAAMLGLLVAFICVAVSQYAVNPLFNGLLSAVIGAILLEVVIWLTCETKGLLTGESANQPVVKGIRALVAGRGEAEKCGS